MIAEVAVVAKICCSCGVDVRTQKRMKDSQGRYWCVGCGLADQKKKALDAAVNGSCAGCFKRMAPKDLISHNAVLFCKKCYKKRSRVSSGPGLLSGLLAMSAAGGDKRRTFVMVGVMAALAFFSILWNFVLN